ncbi:unnamed protein product [Gongylonema pulchrum]|uniref:EB domain-containing protein n=1 Tax=Gongylonema pulchrum TaxID=637853 RepID=A0A183DCV7_9BILA|nr:unnamed protein product [Gongylonema pulchrum]
MYVFAARPTCSQQRPSCGSQFLFCDLRNGPAHCVSKIKFGGRCDRFDGEDACYLGVCSGGFCRPGAFRSVSDKCSCKHPNHHSLQKN